MAVEEGITTLKQCAPFVVVFNQEFSRIDIENRGETMCFEVVERPPLNSDGIQQITVAERTNEGCTERKYLLAQRDETSVAIPLESSSDGSGCLPIGNTPRLFLGFPLVGTEDFSFPVVINSFKFTPTEARDGVYLGKGHNDENVKNQEVIEEACELLIRLLGLTASSRWRNAHLLTEVPAIPGKDWLDPKWLRTCVTENLIEEICQTPAVLNEAGDAVVPKEAMIPLTERDTSVTALWDLLDGGQRNREKMPRRREALGWCNAVGSWARLSEDEPSMFAEAAVDGDKLASRISNECSSLADLQNWLQEEVCAVEWLNHLYGFLRDNGFDWDIRNPRFVPDQVGRFHQLPNLYRDSGIDEELKEIAELLEWRIRRQLRDTQLVPLDEKTGAGDWNSEHVVGKLIDKLKERARENPDNNFKEASARLFAWIVNQRDWNRLQGFPVFAEDGNSDIISLRRAPLDDNQLLVPVQAWAEDLQPYSELFPQRCILNNTFFEKASDPDVWQTLDQENFLRKDVIITKEVHHESFLPARPLTEEDHKTVKKVKVTNVAFLTTDDIGIIDRVRQSQRLARRFWRFLMEWLIVHDSKGLEASKAPCLCDEKHRYYAAEWLVPLVERKWVPLGNRKADNANAQSLAKLLRDNGWDPNSLNQNPAAVKLLEAIGVAESDLRLDLATTNPDERNKLISEITELHQATGGDLEQVRALVQDVKDDKNLLQHLEDRRERIRIIYENQSLGQKVEALVRESLEWMGFSVDRTGTGSDFEISDDIADLGRLDVVRDSQSWLVEVKSTRTQSVQMSAEQSKTAVEKGEEFLLCIVPIDAGNVAPDIETVRAKMRFLKNPGFHFVKPWKDLHVLKEWRDEIANEAASYGIKLVVDAGSPKIEVTRSAWESEGFSLEDLAENLQTNA